MNHLRSEPHHLKSPYASCAATDCYLLLLRLPPPLPPPPQPRTLSLKARHTTAFWWPLYSLLISPVSTHHRRARLSEDAVERKKEPYNWSSDYGWVRWCSVIIITLPSGLVYWPVTIYWESPEKAQSHIQPLDVSPGLLLLMLSSVISEKLVVLQILQVWSAEHVANNLRITENKVSIITLLQQK